MGIFSPNEFKSAAIPGSYLSPFVGIVSTSPAKQAHTVRKPLWHIIRLSRGDFKCRNLLTFPPPRYINLPPAWIGRGHVTFVMNHEFPSWILMKTREYHLLCLKTWRSCCIAERVWRGRRTNHERFITHFKNEKTRDDLEDSRNYITARLCRV